ncbi:MAG: hypothetical protein MJZ01_02200 [Bacteroidales bacterium]|nr:hypothetical protein [Bacteroidales bacterium]
MKFFLNILVVCLLAAMPFMRGEAQRQQPVRIKIERADVLRHDDKIGKNTQSLNGNVILSHQHTFLHCDSAYMYNDSNVVVAYGNVHVIQNDSIHLYGNRITYFGNTNLAKVRENVRANKGNTWLYTEYLDYDKSLDKAYFYDGGKVVNGDNVLTSDNGLYFPNTNDVYFKDNVVGTSPKCDMVSDTMRYNTKSEIITILGPTTIVNSDSTIVKSHDGWYNTQTEEANLLDNSIVITGQKTLTGKRIFYDKRNGIGRVWNDMVLADTVDNMTLHGDYGFYNEKTGAALATRNAQMIHVYQRDTLYMHADTLQIEPLDADSSRLIKAYHWVKFFRSDIQGRCDSLVFDFRDSIATMYKTPIIWAQDNQMTANEIKLFTKNQAIYKSELIDAAFIISPEDTIGYNQIKGKLMTGHIRNNELYRIDVSGNGQTLYYPKDDKVIIGINRAESSDMTIWMNKKKISNITMRVSPSGNMNPPFLLGENECKLAGFSWLEDYKPKCREDIFKKMEIAEGVIVKEEVFEGFSFDELGE